MPSAIEQSDGYPAMADFKASEAAASEPGKASITRDKSSHETTSIEGNRVTYDANAKTNTSVRGTWRENEDAHIRSLIGDAIQDREARENVRANHRNLNRMLTLLGALVIGLVVTFVLYHPAAFHLPLWALKLGPYSFVITVLMDSTLALYSFVRHY